MARVGETIEHPLTGERMTFLETSGSTGGSYLRVRLDVCPGGAVPNLHVHPGSHERFEIVEIRGVVRFEMVDGPIAASHVGSIPCALTNAPAP